MAFTPYYPGGWQSGEEGGTPITPDALNHYDDAFDDVYDAIQDSTAITDLTGTVTGVLDSENGGLGTGVNGAIKLIRPALANDLDNFFIEQPNVSIRLIPSGIYNGSVVGPAGDTGSPSWFVISYKYSATVGSQWGYYPAGTYKGIYVRSNNNGWGAWSKLV